MGKPHISRVGEKSEGKPGWFSLLTFAWVNRPIFAAFKNQQLDVEQLYMPAEHSAERIADEFGPAWEDAVATRGKQKALLARTLLRLYGKTYFLGGVFKLAWSALIITSAFYFVKSLLSYVDDEYTGTYQESWSGWILAVGFAVAAVLWGLCLQRMGYICMYSGAKVRAALLTAVTVKAVSLAEVTGETAGDIVSIVSNDIRKIYDGMQEFHFLWTAPIEATVLLGLIATEFKAYTLPAVGIVAIVMAAQYIFGYRITVNKYRAAKLQHERGGIMQEVLPAIKLVKYYGWESFFEAKILGIRAQEVALLARIAAIKVVNVAMVFTVPPGSAFLIFVTSEFLKGKLESSTAFTALTLFNILRFPLVVLPKALRAASEGSAALARVEAFLLAAHENKAEKRDPTEVAKLGIEIKDAVFQYHGHDETQVGFRLLVPAFVVAPGERVAIIGRVGAGKSALLDALLGRMPCASGVHRVGGRIAYVPQSPWTMRGSIRDNIVWGRPFDEARYEAVLDACALRRDIAILPYGDQSKAGLRGMNLSGGQRQRVNVARAAYGDAETYLLDGALSAVDHTTAEHMFTHCIEGLLADKAVILVTHLLAFVRRCHKVLVLDGGEVRYFGPFTAEAQAIMARYLPVPPTDGAAHEAAKPKKLASRPSKPPRPTADAPPPTSLTMGAAWLLLLKTGRLWRFAIAFVLWILAHSIRQLSDFWVRFWASDKYDWYPLDADGEEIAGGSASRKYALIYGAMALAFFIVQVLRSAAFFWWAQTAANRLFRKALRRVLSTPLAFFLVKPVGELLNIFSSDQDRLDEALPDAFHMAAVYGIVLMATAVTVAINIPEFLAFAAALIVVTAVMLRLYLLAAKQVKAFAARSAGELVGTTAEALEGLEVIQAYEHQRHFVQEFVRQTDRATRAGYNADSLGLWISFYCDLYGAVMLAAVSLFAVGMRERGESVIGLAFSNTIQLLVFYTWTLRMVTEAVSSSAAVEQIGWLAKYTPIGGRDDINNEGQDIHTDVRWRELKEILAGENQQVEADKWASYPADGRIEFVGVHMRYRPSAPLALNGVSLTIAHGEHVGIVGRTGSGKSTLLLALFRMFALAEGTIRIAGSDTADVPLKVHRRGIAIIPQEPFMFSGTLRENLDPLGKHADEELDALIADVGLGEQARACGGLAGHVVGSGAGRWSVGQMQLVCLVRAALNNVPIVCMDEATAALDPHTEKHVLAVAARLFRGRTTLTIAHRLGAVIESDTVVVLETGRVAETGPIGQLLTTPGGQFAAMVDSEGPGEAEALRVAAARHSAAAAGGA